MLVLTRKSQEQIRVGDNITVTVLQVKGNSVRIGIDAPKHIRVVRGELPPKEIELSLDSKRTRLPAPSTVGNSVRSRKTPGPQTNQREDDVDSPPRRRTLKDFVANAHAI